MAWLHIAVFNEFVQTTIALYSINEKCSNGLKRNVYLDYVIDNMYFFLNISSDERLERSRTESELNFKTSIKNHSYLNNSMFYNWSHESN